MLDELSLAVAEREIVTLVGANGSGKSTALKTIIGLTRVTGGALLFDGANITGLAAHRRAALGIGYVPQTQNVFDDLTVADNLRMGALPQPRSPGGGHCRDLRAVPAPCRAANKAREQLERWRAAHALDRPRTLLRPRLLLLDEPSSDLAPALVDSVFEAIQRIHTTLEIPVLLVEQNVSRALALADRVCVLVRGRLALEAPTAAVDREQLRRLFLQGDSAREQA